MSGTPSETIGADVLRQPPETPEVAPPAPTENYYVAKSSAQRRKDRKKIPKGNVAVFIQLCEIPTG